MWLNSQYHERLEKVPPSCPKDVVSANVIISVRELDESECGAQFNRDKVKFLSRE